MDFHEYQRRALDTDQVPGPDGTALLVPLLGLAGEAGTLLSEYKKFLRDGEAHRLHRERVAEELGDLLWYVSNVASKYNLDLDQIARDNLAKVHGRWVLRGRASVTEVGAPRFDTGYPPHERLPRQFDVQVTETRESERVIVQGFVNGEPLGSALTDNAYDPDGYRYHDALHLAFAAVLGWSPVIRALLRRKRKSNPAVDEVEDGGRAIVIEEAIASIAFNYAKDHAFLDGVTSLDESLIRTVMSVSSHLEVAASSAGEWEMTILRGFDVWRELMEHAGGWLTVNLDERAIHFRPV